MASINQACNAVSPAQNGAELAKLLAAVLADLTTVKADLTAINAWQDTLKTKLNADAGVTDVNYAAPDALTTGTLNTTA